MDKHTSGTHSFADNAAINEANNKHTEVEQRFEIAKAKTALARRRVRYAVGEQVGFGPDLKSINLKSEGDGKRGIYFHNSERQDFNTKTQYVVDEQVSLIEQAEKVAEECEEAQKSLWDLIRSELNLAKEAEDGDKIGWEIHSRKQEVRKASCSGSLMEMLKGALS